MGEDGGDGLKKVEVRAFEARESVRSKSDPRLDPRESRLDPRESAREKRESRRLRCGGSSQSGQKSDPVDLENRESVRLCGGGSHLGKESDSDSAAGCCVVGSDAQRVKLGMVVSAAAQSPSYEDVLLSRCAVEAGMRARIVGSSSDPDQ
jgi:hypothetical protein